MIWMMAEIACDSHSIAKKVAEHLRPFVDAVSVCDPEDEEPDLVCVSLCADDMDCRIFTTVLEHEVNELEYNLSTALYLFFHSIPVKEVGIVAEAPAEDNHFTEVFGDGIKIIETDGTAVQYASYRTLKAEEAYNIAKICREHGWNYSIIPIVSKPLYR